MEEINKKNGWEVGIHVDGASGGFVAPFVYPDLEWDFRVKNVVSINASGHKYTHSLSLFLSHTDFKAHCKCCTLVSRSVHEGAHAQQKQLFWCYTAALTQSATRRCLRLIGARSQSVTAARDCFASKNRATTCSESVSP